MEKKAVASVTLADIYLEQGHIEMCIEVYTELVKREPYNDVYKKRLAALKKERNKGHNNPGKFMKALRKKLW